MEIYIGDIRLPVVEPTFEIEEPHDLQEAQVVNYGGVSLVGKRGLKTFTYSSFYPKEYDSSYCNFSNLLDPTEFVKKMLSYKNDSLYVRLVIPSMLINGLFTINSFVYKPIDGTDDIGYSVSMKEYRHPFIPEEQHSYEVYNFSYTKEEKETETGYHTVKQDETIITIARKYNMSVKVLYNDNESVIGPNPNAITPGMKLWIRGNT